MAENLHSLFLLYKFIHSFAAAVENEGLSGCWRIDKHATKFDLFVKCDNVHVQFRLVTELMRRVTLSTTDTSPWWRSRDRKFHRLWVPRLNSVSEPLLRLCGGVVFVNSIRGWRRTSLFRLKYSSSLLQILKSPDKQSILKRLEHSVLEAQQELTANLAGQFTVPSTPPLTPCDLNRQSSYSASTEDRASDATPSTPTHNTDPMLATLFNMITQPRINTVIPRWKQILPNLWIDMTCQQHSRAVNNSLRITHVVLVGTGRMSWIEESSDFNWAVLSSCVERALFKSGGLKEVVNFIHSGLMCGGSVVVTLDWNSSAITAALLVAYFMHTLNLTKSKATGVTTALLGEAIASRINWAAASNVTSHHTLIPVDEQ